MASANNMTQSADLGDTSHSLMGMRKSLADYEEVVGKNKSSDLGKGSYGNVKLVREKKTGLLFAMKAVIFETEPLNAIVEIR